MEARFLLKTTTAYEGALSLLNTEAACSGALLVEYKDRRRSIDTVVNAAGHYPTACSNCQRSESRGSCRQADGPRRPESSRSQAPSASYMSGTNSTDRDQPATLPFCKVFILYDVLASKTAVAK